MGYGVFTLFGIIYPINFFLATTTVKLAVSSGIVDIIRYTYPQHTYWIRDLDFVIGCRVPFVLSPYYLLSRCWNVTVDGLCPCQRS